MKQYYTIRLNASRISFVGYISVYENVGHIDLTLDISIFHPSTSLSTHTNKSPRYARHSN